MDARGPSERGRTADTRVGGRRGTAHDRSHRAAGSAATTATSQQQAATAQQQQATAQQQAATAQQQAATAQQQAAARPAGAPPAGTVVNALPAGCKPETKSGVEYQNCGGVLYRSGFQGNNLVYVAQ